jgi:hypothetical protein
MPHSIKIPKRLQTGRGVIDSIKKAYKKLVEYPNTAPSFPGEIHFPGHNYTGPGTQIEARLERGDKPVDEVDAIAKEHDIDYLNASKMNGTKEEKAAAIQAADEKMISSLRGLSSNSISKLAAMLGIGSKNVFEKLLSKLAKKPIAVYGTGKKKKSNPWMVHLAKVRKANPKLNMKQAMQKAKLSYTQKGGSDPIRPNPPPQRPPPQRPPRNAAETDARRRIEDAARQIRLANEWLHGNVSGGSMKLAVMPQGFDRRLGTF